MLVCVRWYAAYPLSLRNLEEMMAERGVLVDHATIHRRALNMLPVVAAVLRRVQAGAGPDQSSRQGQLNRCQQVRVRCAQRK